MELATAPALDEAKLGAFMEKALGDFSGCDGDRSRHARRSPRTLLKSWPRTDPRPRRSWPDRADVDERYAAEWLRGLTAAGYLEP